MKYKKEEVPRHKGHLGSICELTCHNAILSGCGGINLTYNAWSRALTLFASYSYMALL